MQVNQLKCLGFFTITLLVTLLFISSTVNGQRIKSAPLSWGLKGGINLATLYGDDVSDTEILDGFNGGLFFNYAFGPHLSLQPEVLFSRKGTELDNSISGEETTTDYELGYLEVPVMLKYHLTTGNTLNPNILVGPAVGFKLYGDANDQDIDDEMQDAEFGLTFGGGLDAEVASSPTDFIQTVGLDLRYTLGLTDVFDIAGDPEAKNRVFTIALAVGF